MHVPGAVHPVLAQRHLDPLPPLPTLEGLSFEDGYLGAVGGEAHAAARADEDSTDEVCLQVHCCMADYGSMMMI